MKLLNLFLQINASITISDNYYHMIEAIHTAIAVCGFIIILCLIIIIFQNFLRNKMIEDIKYNRNKNEEK